MIANEEETFFRNANEIASGVLKVQVHTYGEYFNDADPKELLESCNIYGLSGFKESDSFESVCDAIRQKGELTERSVADLARVALASWDEHGHDTQITQTLAKGKIDIRVETGEGIVPLEDDWEYIRNNKGRKKENAQYDFKRRMEHYGLDKVNYLARAKKLAEEYDALSLQDQAIDWSGKVFCFIGYIGDLDYYYYYSKYDKEAMEYTKCSCVEPFNNDVDYVVLGFKSIKAADEYEASVTYDFFDRHYEELMAHLLECKEHHIRILFNDQFKQEVDHLKQKDNARLYSDLYAGDTLISIEKKHFVLTDLQWDEDWIVNRVKKYGGIVHSNAVKMADYCVVGSQKDIWFGYSPKVKHMLEWKHKGSNVRFIPIEALISVLKDDQTREENERLAAIESKKEEAAQIRKAEEKRIQVEEARKQQEEARRLRAEERHRKAEQARAQQEEARRIQRRIQEKEMRKRAELAKQQKERLAEEAKAQKEQARQDAIANAVILYAPGKEPENLRMRLNTLFEKLNGAYPDKVISGLQKDHKKWAEAVTELYRLLGYPDGQAFLEAYGYTVVQNAGGRKATVDPVAIMEELHRRYPNGGATSVAALRADNPDIPWKTLSNNAREYFGNTLTAHLKEIGVLQGGSDGTGKSGEGTELSQILTETGDEPVDYAWDANVNIQTAQVTVEKQPEKEAVLFPAIQEGSVTDLLTWSEQKYIQTIRELMQKGLAVRAVDICGALGYSSAAVSNALRKLRGKGIIRTTASGVISLSENETNSLAESSENSSSFALRTDLTASEIKYLSAVEELNRKMGVVRATDIADYLGVSKASVS